MPTEDKFTYHGPSPAHKADTTSVTPEAGGKAVKGVEGEAPPPDDQPKREDEDLSALLQNPNANQKPK